MLTEKLLHNYSNFSSLILVSYIQVFVFFLGLRQSTTTILIFLLQIFFIVLQEVFVL